MPVFTTDWVTSRVPEWEHILSKFEGLPGLQALEIGIYEGHSTLWFLEHILTHPTSHIFCIDPYYKDIFTENTRQYTEKISLYREKAEIELRHEKYHPGQFDFIYIDGDHRAPAVLEMSVLCHRLLKKAGILVFDDYLWQSPQGNDPVQSPKLAIDCFLAVYKNHYRVLHHGYQVIIEKMELED